MPKLPTAGCAAKRFASSTVCYEHLGFKLILREFRTKQHLRDCVDEALEFSSPDNHIKAIYLLALCIIQRPIPDDGHLTNPWLPEGHAERAVLRVVHAQRLVHRGIESGQLPWRLLHT